MIVDAPSLIDQILGHDRIFDDWKNAVSSGRLHHAWLLHGPKGVGKAHVALRLAATLLGVPEGQPEHPVARLIHAGSHPDLRTVGIPVDEKGKAKTEIPVDSVRELSRFFAMRPALGGWRVGIIDSVGELNRNGANAILKTLEEPPERCVLFLILHEGDVVLPTIRSRCRTVKMTGLSEADTVRVLRDAGLNEADAVDAARLAPAQPGRALALASDEGLAGFRAARGYVGRAGSGSAQSLGGLVKAGSKSQTSFDAAVTTIRRELMEQARSEAAPGRAGAIAYRAAQVAEISREASALNMDRAQALVRIVEVLRAGAKS